MRIDMRNSVECNDGTFSITNGAIAPCVNSGGVKTPKSKFDYSGINEILKNSIPFNPPFMQKPANKTGSDFSKQREIEKQQNLALEQAKLDAEKAINDAQKNKTKEPIYYILVTAGVLIAGYFAYKQFKK